MNDSFFVGGVESGGHLPTDAHHHFGRELASVPVEPLTERVTAQVLHHDKRGAFVGGAKLVDVNDAGVLGHARRLGFIEEAGGDLPIVSEALVQDLDGGAPLHLIVHSLVDLPHSA